MICEHCNREQATKARDADYPNLRKLCWGGGSGWGRINCGDARNRWLTAEVVRLRAAVARVEALADEWGSGAAQCEDWRPDTFAAELRAARGAK